MKNTTNNKTDINDISILTSSHSTFDTRIFHKEACSLANAGYDVTLITPHYESTVRNGVKIKAVGSEDSESADFGHAREIYTEAKNTETDVYHFHDPGLIPFAILLSYELDAKVIYDCHEDYKRAFRHYNYPPDYLNPITTRLYPTLQSLSARRFDGVVAATDWIARDFNKRGHENVTLVRNFPKKSILKSDNISIKAEHKHTLVYVGGLSEQRGLFRMLRLTRDLRDQGMDIGLWLIGYLNSNDENKAKKYINKNGLESNIRLFGYVDPDKLFDYLKSADIGLCLLNSKRAEYIIPTKMFEYMYSELPIIATRTTATKQYLPDDCGILVSEEAAEWVKAAKEILLNSNKKKNMGKAGKKRVETKYCWETEQQHLLSFYKDL